MTLSTFQTQNTFKRWREREDIRSHNLDLIHQERFFDIDSPQRIQKFLSRRGLSQASLDDFQPLKATTGTTVKTSSGIKQFLNLERILGANDLVHTYFLEDALHISKTVGRIWICDSSGMLRGYGNGFMVSPSLMLTNFHVLADAESARHSKIEFNYQLKNQNKLSDAELFELDPDTFFYSFEELDFALIAVKPINTSGALLSSFGYNRLLKEEGKTIISQWLNIIQHPAGMPKQVAFRGNQLIDIMENFIHYSTDTVPGSSGSPVYNERWEVVAIHHSGVWEEDKDGHILALNGGQWTASMGEDQIKWKANEGVRISSILKHLERQSFLPQQQLLLNGVLYPAPAVAGSAVGTSVSASVSGAASGSVNLELDANGRITCSFPVAISFALKELLQGKTTLNTPIHISLGNTGTPSVVTQQPNVLEQAKIEFSKWKEVLDVRMGYVFKNGWITNERALVVTVKKRKSLYDLQKEGAEALPDQFMNYPVEVSGPTIEELIAWEYGRNKLESLLSSAEVLKEEIKYLPPPNIPLKAVSQTMNVIAHVSPEEGWKNLHPFLSNTQQTLTIAMYDFGAKHILETVDTLAGKATFENLTLTIQAGENVGEGTKANDLKDEEVVKDLVNKFETKFHSAWIPIGKVNGWVASSYHIKVAVRDHRSFWLSSGNWQSSNQPQLEKLSDFSPAKLLRTYNREWHVIVENEELAQTYERFIQYDYKSNKDYKVKRDELTEDLNFIIPVNALENIDQAGDLELFKPFSENRLFTVTPLLTPDNFHSEVLALINSAESELLIQNQTFNAPNPGQSKLEELITAVLKKQQEGVDVKIIFRVIHPASARKNLEKLIEMGFNKDNIRLQRNCHNKGIIIDKKNVLIGSQNWSNDGVSVNRDASLIFDDEKLAAYFRTIFLHDWTKLAHQNIGREAYSIELATDLNNIPKGMELLSWTEVKEFM